MGKEFTNLTCEELCDLMCGKPEDEIMTEKEMRVGKNKEEQARQLKQYCENMKCGRNEPCIFKNNDKSCNIGVPAYWEI